MSGKRINNKGIRKELTQLATNLKGDDGKLLYDPADLVFLYENGIFSKDSKLRFGACSTGKGKSGKHLADCLGAVFQPHGGLQAHSRITSQTSSQNAFDRFADNEYTTILMPLICLAADGGTLLFSGDPIDEWRRRHDPIRIIEIPDTHSPEKLKPLYDRIMK